MYLSCTKNDFMFGYAKKTKLAFADKLENKKIKTNVDVGGKQNLFSYL